MELIKMIGVEFYGVIQEFVKIIVIWRSKTLPKGFAWYFVIARDYIILIDGANHDRTEPGQVNLLTNPENSAILGSKRTSV